MPGPSAQLLYSRTDEGVVFRLVGKPSLDVSHHLRSAADRFLEGGRRQFAVELGACPSVDSTFIGVLLYLSNAVRKTSGGGGVSLLNLNDQVRRQIDALGVLERFQLANTRADGVQFESVNVAPADRAAATRVCLEAHRNLVEASSGNAERFRDVIRFLEEDLGKQP